MNRVRRHRTPIIFGLLLIGLFVTACSPSAEKMNNDGNEAYAEAAYVEALAAYESAQIESPELAEPYYNAANVLYREGAYNEAMMLMQEALKYTDAEPLEQSSFYNTGNSAFNLQEWETAISAYTEALLRNPDDQEAKYNLELALQQMQQQQEEQEQQSEEEQEEQEQSEEGESQEDESEDQSENGEEQQNQEQQGDKESSEGEEDQEQEGQDGQPEDEESGEQESPGQMPQPGQRMTPEQARQLLAAIAQDTETLQERLGQIFIAPPIPPTQDW
jgi:Ca-activated chloride channel family protein